MVLVICFFNIICQLPVLILTIYGLINDNPCGRRSALLFVGLLFVSNLLLIVNHSINFFIYSLTNHKFRYALRTMCRHCCFFRDSSHSQTKSRQYITKFDDDRKSPHPRSITPKFECNTRSYSRSPDTARLMVTIHETNSIHTRVRNKQLESIAL